MKTKIIGNMLLIAIIIASTFIILSHEIKQNNRINWCISYIDSLNSMQGSIIELQQLTVYKVDSLNTKVNNRLKYKTHTND
jgi:uncharacterized membrane protein